jgi:IS5 family transposase
MSHDIVGTSAEGADAYPPPLLFKCLMLQKWFRINSDPELENQINDRLSFKKFLQLPLDKPSPDHSTFSRFRSRLSKARYIVEQYFGISHLHDEAKRVRFTTTADNKFDVWCRQVYPVQSLFA